MKLKVCDAHCDTLSRIVTNTPMDQMTVTPQRLREGGVSIQVLAMFATYGGGMEPYEKGLKMLEASRNYPLNICRGTLPDELPDEPTGVLSIEGGEILKGSLENFYAFDDAARLRMIALTWNHENEIAHPAKEGPEGGLKPFGLSLVREMDKHGVLCDVSHLNEAGFWDVAEHSALPIVASHSNFREKCDHFRNLNRDQVKAMIEKKGYIGINFFSAFLAKDRPATLDDVFTHVDALMQLGCEDVIGFGSDFDGIDEWPEGLATPLDFPALLDFLKVRGGYSDAAMAKMAGGNMFRVLKAAEAARRV